MRQVLVRLKAIGTVVQSIVTDPPYHLTSIVKRFGGEGAAPAKSKQTGAFARSSRGFMGKQWDGGDIAFDPATWRLCFDLLPPGGRLLAFSGTRTYHRMACAIEDAGFIVMDMKAWLYGSGFPKSHDFGAAFDKALLGIDRDEDPKDWEASRSHFATYWEGWGSAVKPAMEPICVAMKPLDGTIAGNVAAHGVGGLNIDGCRVHADDAQGGAYTVRRLKPGSTLEATGGNWRPQEDDFAAYHGNAKPGRFPANVVHDGSDEVLAAFPAAPGQLARTSTSTSASASASARKDQNVYGAMARGSGGREPRGDEGSAARFFYSAKADAADRLGSKHPTVKPVDMMRWMVRLVTPPGGTVLDPFAGSGTTGMACMAEGFDCILVEREAEYAADIRRRIAHVTGQDGPLFQSAPARAAE